jgi:cytochrome c oxidase assembly factor CtaG
MRTLTTILLLMVPAGAFAHGSAASDSIWTFDAWIVGPLLLSAILYTVGTTAVWRHAGKYRGIKLWQAAAYVSGWLLLFGALVSPLHWLGEHLFTFHMIEHEIIIAFAAPLIAVGRPLGAMVWALPKPLRRGIGSLARAKPVGLAWRIMTRPLYATLLHGVTIWIWHAPSLFDMAVQQVAWHRLQHVSFLVTALIFWWSLLRRADYGNAAGHLFVTMLHTSVLGALMALAPRVLYQVQTADAYSWGITPLQDQQLAGLVMWVPAGTVYAGFALVLAALWIGRADRVVALPEYNR